MPLLADLRPRLEAILDRAIESRAFPGAVARLEWRGQVLEAARGRRGYAEPFIQPADERTVYDLASLSKLWTLTAALLAMRARRLSPGTPLHELLPDFGLPDKRGITIRHLMMHASGIGLAIQSLARQAVPREDWMARIASEPLGSAPGERVLYSCTNYFLLARALELEPLDEPLLSLIADGRTIYAPGSSLTLRPQALGSRLIAPTEVDPQTGQALRGVVHDEAARVWSGPPGFSFAGNAGLFGDAAAVAGFLRLWTRDGCLHPDDIASALGDALPEGLDGTRRGWGWQIDNPLFCGRAGVDAPRGSFGHAGFTGPTMWAHRETQSACIILNNRVHPSRESANRFPFHREVSALLGEFVREMEPRGFGAA